MKGLGLMFYVKVQVLNEIFMLGVRFYGLRIVVWGVESGNNIVYVRQRQILALDAELLVINRRLTRTRCS